MAGPGGDLLRARSAHLGQESSGLGCFGVGIRVGGPSRKDGEGKPEGAGVGQSLVREVGAAVLCIAKGVCGTSPSTVKSTLLADAAAQPSTYGFAGSPSDGTKYYGHLAYAGSY